MMMNDWTNSPQKNMLFTNFCSPLYSVNKLEVNSRVRFCVKRR